jgi:pimeloyl-ACP methyl ester carboxylesterase
MLRTGALARALLIAVSAVIVAASAACGGESPATPSATSTSSAQSIADIAPPPAERCNKPDGGTAAKTVVTAPDGPKLAGVEWGTGPRGVVLLPQRGADLCPWWDFATQLVDAGYHVLAIDFRGNGYSESAPVRDLTRDAVGAVEWLKQAGAENVVLIGASMGATTALVTAGRHPDLVAGVVSLSMPPSIDVTGGDTEGPTTPQEAAPQIKASLLMCWATSDRSATDPQPIVDASPATDKQVVTREGGLHGWGLLSDGPHDVRPEVLAFLEQVLPASM